MGLRQPITAALCAVAVIANPLMAAWQPCCCTQKRVESASHCVAPPVATVGKSCCAKPRPEAKPQHVTAVRPCGCCVKTTSSPLTGRSELLKPAPPIDWISSNVAPLGPMLSTISHDQIDVGLVLNRGPALLALLCRWLK